MSLKTCIKSISWNKNTWIKAKDTPVIISLISGILIQALETFFLPEPWQIHLGKYFLTGDSLRPLLWILCHLFAFRCIGPTTTSNRQDHDIICPIQYWTIYLNFGLFKLLSKILEATVKPEREREREKNTIKSQIKIMLQKVAQQHFKG